MSEQVFTSCTNAGPISVYVKTGKVVRIRPLVADEKDFEPWTIEANGKKYSPRKKFNLSPYVHAERQRLYSEDRIKYPMIRIDFDPNGDRNQQNRGKSPDKRVGWDEALDVVAGEIRRIRDTHGGASITGMTSSHHNWGVVGYKMGPFYRFMNMLEYTPVFDNPDSWEGWHWGATHTPTAFTGGSACPYRVIYWNEERNIPQKCTFCAHLLDEGWNEPRCVEACPTGALVFGDLNDPESDISKIMSQRDVETLHPEFGLEGGVSYIGLPKRFIAGEVVLADRQEECAERVKVTLINGKETRTVETDNYGDFEFDGLLHNRSYTIRVDHKGYVPREMTV